MEWRPVKSINFSLLAGEEIASTLGKRGTQTDITLYDKKESGIIRTYVVPNGFPEKIQSLLQAINLAEYAIIHLDTLDRFAGEQILALDALRRTDGILSHNINVDHDSVLRAVKDTVVEKYRFVEPSDIRVDTLNFDPMVKHGDARVVVDHCFDVKGVGTVALGRVISGSISKYDTLVLQPRGVQATIKSIQMHDDPVGDAISPARVGLALKGVRPDQVRRGDVLCGGTMPIVSDTISLNFTKVQYYKGEPTVNQMCIASVGLQVVSGKISSTEPLSISLDRPAVYEIGERCVLLKPESSIRIMGSGALL